MESRRRFVSFQELQVDEKQQNKFDMENLFHTTSSCEVSSADLESLYLQ